MRVLLTGGAGFIGSHTAVALVEAGHEVVLFDNFANSSPIVVSRLEALLSREMTMIEADARDMQSLRGVLMRENVDSVVHFAGLKAVGESTVNPLAYYDVNLGSTVAVLQAMEEAGVKKLVFSSSATVYEKPGANLVESDDVGVDLSNPYGRTKLMCESIIGDASAADSELQAGILRYFNPIGAHPSGMIGEDPVGVPNNLIPFIAQVASGARERLRIFGDDYDTHDGTGVRDYIHVMDLAVAHVAMLEQLREGVEIVNVGTGRGTSVREALSVFSQVVGRDLPAEVVPRRPGDAAVTTADPSYARKRLGWVAARTFEDACRDAWNWQRQNPTGYVG